jgi:predicted RNA binding protein YcfA (HicA-like mRNA interferase family)
MKNNRREVFALAMISPDKEIRRIVRELERAGFVVTKKSSKHVKVFNPETGQQVSIPSTPAGNGRQRQNMYMSLRQIGFDVSALKGTNQKKKEKTNG